MNRFILVLVAIFLVLGSSSFAFVVQQGNVQAVNPQSQSENMAMPWWWLGHITSYSIVKVPMHAEEMD